ncbi:MAG TPA: hypothetical protein VJ347_15505 [Streptosporangiaceae bacterium]|nr:hypothetical protein [Streptosporangiaceae bacterium]
MTDLPLIVASVTFPNTSGQNGEEDQREGEDEEGALRIAPEA